MWLFNIAKKLIVFLFAFFYLGCSAKESETLKSEFYILTYEDDSDSLKWAEYAFNQLSNRSKGNEIVKISLIKEERLSQSNDLQIHWKFDASLKQDYCINRKGKLLQISVKSDKTALWMVYQLIEAISQSDVRFDSTDLTPAIVEFNSHCKTFDFEYREPHYLSNLKIDGSALLGNNNVEIDWGIWGHNLSKIVKENEDERIYALVNGQRNKAQFCFASDQLFRCLSNYIIDDYGYGHADERYRFMIMPQDNNLVCECSLCQEFGNSQGTASNAVNHLLGKLADRFINHDFYMVAYRTTKAIPQKPLKKNTGVFVSTIDVPKGVGLEGGYKNDKNTREFIQQIKDWKTVSDQVYIWDYSSNFDDYLSPLPILYSLQKQLTFYKKLGVTGVFYNAAGYDYSSFEDLQTYIISALLKDTTVNVDLLVKQYFEKFYPESSELLTKYYLNLEDQYSKKGKAFDMYGSMASILGTYLNKEDFVKFYKELERVKRKIDGDEYKRLTQLYTALTFTRAQIGYHDRIGKYGFVDDLDSKLGVKEDVFKWIATLKSANTLSILNYKEAGGSLSAYFDFWQEQVDSQYRENLLVGHNIQISTTASPLELSYLTDGLLGYKKDFHLGWFINYQTQIELSIPVAELEGLKKLQLRFLKDEEHRFVAPLKIELWSNGKEIKDLDMQINTQESNIILNTVNIDLTEMNTLVIKITNDSSKRNAIACDEILLMNVENYEK